MNDYVEVKIGLRHDDGGLSAEDAADLLAASLGEAGYESFVHDSDGLTAYVAASAWSEAALRQAIDDFPFDIADGYTFCLIEGRDWNEEWERNYFQPIVVGDKCVVHSSFHTDIPTVPYDIVIDPKMAFGTGHHATTSLILSRLLDMDLTGRAVIDMGTGTGILAILAAMRGAARVDAVEIDEFAYNNAVENVALNGHSEINVILGDAAALGRILPADLFIANINRNVITGDIEAYAASLVEGGTMLLSGFYTCDIPVVEGAAAAAGLTLLGHTEKDRWACLELVKNKKQ